MFGERAAILYNKGKFSLDLSYLHSHGKEYSTTREESKHALSTGVVYDVLGYEVKKSKTYGHDYRLGASYKFAENNELSFIYQGFYNDVDVRDVYTGDILGNTNSSSHRWMHNMRLDYTAPFGMKVGAEAFYYHSPERQTMASTLPTGLVQLNVQNDQRINSWRFYLSQEHDLKRGWSINYGTWYKTTINHSLQVNNTGSLGRAYLRQEEKIFNVYSGVQKSFNDKLILEASVAAEYYHTPTWNNWTVYPTLSLTYLPNRNNIWVLNFNTDRKYPEYWAMNDLTTYNNGGYNEIKGNPELKPSTQYQAQLVYILKSKYQFATWFSHTKDYFIQTAYQRSDRLVMEFKNLNFNYQQQFGVQSVLPHKFGSFLDSKLTLTGVWMHEKCDDFYDIPFNRHVIYGIATLNNVIKLSSKPNISLTVDGSIRSRAKQAIYDLPGSGYLNLGMNWKFWKEQATLHVFCNDIFETSTIDPRINYMGQQFNMDLSCFRQIGISLTIKFGGYKEKRKESIDTSRLRKL